ncbi:MAG: acyl-CoA thioesterase [Acidobacteria bacterium]|nr:acyl-CoA thioesterase [Acidobacteriota bacterium]
MHVEKQKTPAERLEEYPVTFSMPVQWGDQDPFGHVNNVMYFRWCETARISYLDRTGIWDLYRNENIGPIIASIHCNFRQPVVYPDQIHVGAKVSKLGNRSFQMDHLIISDALGVVADATSTLVIFDYKKSKSHPIPDTVREAIRRIEAQER